MRLKKDIREQKETLRRSIDLKREIADWLIWKCKKLNINLNEYMNKHFMPFYEKEKDQMIADQIDVDAIIRDEIEKMGGLKNVK